LASTSAVAKFSAYGFGTVTLGPLSSTDKGIVIVCKP
jgi:hypothetical protein